MTVLSKYKIFQCDQCQYKYKVKKMLEINGKKPLFNHFLSCHSQLSAADKLCCDLCDFLTFYRPSMTAHICWVHDMGEEVLKVVCDECPNGDKYVKESLIDHYIRRHSQIALNIFDCAECGFTAKGKDNIIEHVWTRHLQAIRPIICRHCGLQFDGRENTRLHMKAVHPRFYVCDVCGKRYPSSDRKGLTGHIADDHQGAAMTTAVCDHCDTQVQGLFLNQNLWRHLYHYHISQNARDQPACDHCGMQITRGCMFKHYLNRHCNSAAVAITYQCDKCPRMTTSKSNLLVHIRRHHLPQRRLPCDMCDAVYYKSNSLFVHKKFVHEQVRVVCNPCGKVFVDKLNLLRHNLKKHV